jgi:hypothetical protein
MKFSSLPDDQQKLNSPAKDLEKKTLMFNVIQQVLKQMFSSHKDFKDYRF